MGKFGRPQIDDTFLTFPRKQDLTFHSNCLQFAFFFAWRFILNQNTLTMSYQEPFVSSFFCACIFFFFFCCEIFYPKIKFMAQHMQLLKYIFIYLFSFLNFVLTFFFFIDFKLLHVILHNNIMKISEILNNITKTYLYNFDPLEPHFYIVKLGFTGVHII